MELTLEYHQDPAHGWLKVPQKIIKDLGIAGEITPYSYKDVMNGYLEEDCDMSLFMQKAKLAGFSVILVDKFTNHDSSIRNLPRWSKS